MISQVCSQDSPECNTPTPPEQTDIDPDLFPYTIRRVYPLGKSLVLSLPPRWAARHDLRTHRYCQVHVEPDGSLSIRPLALDPPQDT